MKKNILLLMPFFMGYEKALLEELKKEYQVTLLDSEEFGEGIRKEYSTGKVRWGMRHLCGILKKWDQKTAENIFLTKCMQKVCREPNYYDVVFVINGHYFPDLFFREMKRLNPNGRFILYLWDDLANLFKTSHLSFFGEKYSYNLDDCKRKKMSYLPMFLQKEKAFSEVEKEYDISFVATAHSDRIEIAKRLLLDYNEKYKLFIYLYSGEKTEESFCFQTPLSYEKYLEILKKSKATLDVPAVVQTGPTTRFFDALVTKTKIITTNEHIKKYPVFSENVLIVDRKKMVVDDAFLEREYVDINYRSMTISQWLEKVGL